MSTDITYDTLLDIFQACEEEVQLAKKDTGKDDHLAAIYESTYRTVIGKELQKRGLDTWTMKIRGARIMLEINFRNTDGSVSSWSEMTSRRILQR